MRRIHTIVASAVVVVVVIFVVVVVVVASRTGRNRKPDREVGAGRIRVGGEIEPQRRNMIGGTQCPNCPIA